MTVECVLVHMVRSALEATSLMLIFATKQVVLLRFIKFVAMFSVSRLCAMEHFQPRDSDRSCFVANTISSKDRFR